PFSNARCAATSTICAIGSSSVESPSSETVIDDQRSSAIPRQSNPAPRLALVAGTRTVTESDTDQAINSFLRTAWAGLQFRGFGGRAVLTRVRYQSPRYCRSRQGPRRPPPLHENRYSASYSDRCTANPFPDSSAASSSDYRRLVRFQPRRAAAHL